MAISDFGMSIRKARIEAGNISLSSMARDLQTTPSFLSSLERGRKKIPAKWVGRIEEYFRQQGVVVALGELADVANKSISLDGLSFAQQMLVASLARVHLDATEIGEFWKLLKTATGTRR